MITQKVAVVTGGNSGIGKAITEKLVEANYNVIITGRNIDTIRKMENDLGASVKGYTVNSSQSNEIKDFAETIKAEYKNIDVLVNNSGFVKDTKTTLDYSELEANWDDMIDTMLKGSFLMSVALSPIINKPGGRIINIGSIAAITGGRNAGSTGYAAAKAGLHGLTFGLARELSPQGITVNTVAPGFIANTGFTGEWPQSVVDSFVNITPMKRAGHVDDIASAVRYLASDEASFITGEIINVNGGQIFGRG